MIQFHIIIQITWTLDVHSVRFRCFIVLWCLQR